MGRGIRPRAGGGLLPATTSARLPQVPSTIPHRFPSREFADWGSTEFIRWEELDEEDEAVQIPLRLEQQTPNLFKPRKTQALYSEKRMMRPKTETWDNFLRGRHNRQQKWTACAPLRSAWRVVVIQRPRLFLAVERNRRMRITTFAVTRTATWEPTGLTTRNEGRKCHVLNDLRHELSSSNHKATFSAE